ncbi:MAG TPA: LCP family protein [Candidatus Limnocylindrales bacterium]|jgi:LCP family protein required for cell wall assembly
MSNPQAAPVPERKERPPRQRSAFASAFLSLLFPGLGHAYAGAFGRALAFAAAPLLGIALIGGIVLRADRNDVLGFFAQESVLQALFVLNLGLLIYRVIAAIDAWNVARFLNDADRARIEAATGRVTHGGRARSPLSIVSIGGLLAVLVVMAGAHLAVARYNALALNLVQCVFSEDDTNPDCSSGTPSPSLTAGGGTSQPSASASVEASPTDVLPTPEGSGATGTPAPTLPPWDGKERLNVLLVGSDQRPGDSSFNTDTMIVVSVDPSTGEVAMFQVPRDMVDVPVPSNARSVWGSVYRGKINSWFTQNRNRTDLWPGTSQNARGFAALKGLLGELYGLDIRYYALVNFEGFRKVVNALGGVNINVQIPVAESQYPMPGGALARIYIPAGPQHMSGGEALIYARSRHRATDFDRGRRQQRVLLSLREQMNAQAIVANLPDLVNALKDSVKTDIKTRDLPKLLSLAESVDTKNIRSFVFSPTYYATEFQHSDRGYIITPNVARIRRAVDQAFNITPQLLARREQLEEEAATLWVINGSGRAGLETSTASYLEYQGITASAPRRQTTDRPAKTTIVVYNGAETELASTIAYLEKRFKATVTTATDPKVTVDIVVTLGKDAPTLDIDAVG